MIEVPVWVIIPVGIAAVCALWELTHRPRNIGVCSYCQHCRSWTYWQARKKNEK
jgi:hypothetical protein